MRGISALIFTTFSDWYEDRAPRLGAALAYYTVFALAPSLVIVIGVAGIVLGREAAQGQILDQTRNSPRCGPAAAAAVSRRTRGRYP
jgi:membrane protein